MNWKLRPGVIWQNETQTQAFTFEFIGFTLKTLESHFTRKHQVSNTWISPIHHSLQILPDRHSESSVHMDLTSQGYIEICPQENIHV